jgi:hypothetical protein
MILEEVIDENKHRKYSQKTDLNENPRNISSYNLWASETQYGITSPSINNLRQNQLIMTDKKNIWEEDKLSAPYDDSEYKTPKSKLAPSVIK